MSYNDYTYKGHIIDPYRVCKIYSISDPAIQHAIKKVLCAGKRGVKSAKEDLREAIYALNRHMDMLEEDDRDKDNAYYDEEGLSDWYDSHEWDYSKAKRVAEVASELREYKDYTKPKQDDLLSSYTRKLASDFSTSLYLTPTTKWELATEETRPDEALNRAIEALAGYKKALEKNGID